VTQVGSNSSLIRLRLLAHAPELSAQSPGKLHLLQLRAFLGNDGMHLLDLTPGGDVWKDRFAQSHDTAFEVTPYRSAFLCRLVRLRDVLVALWNRIRR